MQTRLADFIRDTPEGLRAESILRACVHCGFCTATCPTYQLLGDELDGPRGRIYLIKQVLEGEMPDRPLQTHLDRCLVCRACETTCPSGVDYHLLLDIGRETVARRLPRPWPQRVLRRGLAWLFGDARRLAPVMRLARAVRPLLPRRLRAKIPPRPAPLPPHPVTARRRMLLLQGCVQPVLAPQIDQALQRILARLDIELLTAPGAGCCGALPQHLDQPARAREMARRNIDAWWPLIEAGAEALLISASGCHAQVRDYPLILAEDPDYRERAQVIAGRARDPLQILAEAEPARLPVRADSRRVAVHTPCSLQHGLRLNGALEALLQRLGFELARVGEGHLCCGSAGTYSLTQPAIAGRLRRRKLTALTQDEPDLIVTANIGCLTHLQDPDGPPVMHWLNLLERSLA